VHTELGIALRSGCGPNDIGGLLHQQGFIAMQGVQTAQTFLQMRLELGQGQLHKSMALQMGMRHKYLLALKAL
jgi:hypothetical protein